MRDALSSGSINLATRMGSVKSAHRRAGKVKGIDRFLGTLETASQELMETSSGEIEIFILVPKIPSSRFKITKNWVISRKAGT